VARAATRWKAIVESEKLEDEADQLFNEGREANQTSDNYVLATIVFLGGLVRLVTLPFL